MKIQDWPVSNKTDLASLEKTWLPPTETDSWGLDCANGQPCSLAGVSAHDERAAIANLPPVDSINMWPYLSGKVDALQVL